MLEKDLDANVLIVGQGHDHPLGLHRSLEAGQWQWCSGQAITSPRNCYAKSRYRQADQACHVEPLPNGRLRVDFETPQRAITPGQSVVLYDGEVCLGGGIIESRQH